MTKTVLLTRSTRENLLLKAKLEAKLKCIECDLISYHPLPFDYLELNKYTDIIITSKYAAMIISSSDIKDKFAWVVGEVSAKILIEKGYKIKYVAENSLELLRQIPENIYSNAVYLSGNIITTEMPSAIHRKIIYNVIYREILTGQMINEIKNGIDFILLYSENCAKTLIKLLQQNNLVKNLENSIVIGISSKVIKIISNYFKNTIACKNSKDMIKILENYD